MLLLGTCTYLFYLMPTTMYVHCIMFLIVQVVFVDYGNEEIVQQDELCEMPQEYYQYSMQVQLDLHVAGLSTMHAVPAS